MFTKKLCTAAMAMAGLCLAGQALAGSAPAPMGPAVSFDYPQPPPLGGENQWNTYAKEILVYKRDSGQPVRICDNDDNTYLQVTGRIGVGLSEGEPYFIRLDMDGVGLTTDLMVMPNNRVDVKVAGAIDGTTQIHDGCEQGDMYCIITFQADENVKEDSEFWVELAPDVTSEMNRGCLDWKQPLEPGEMAMVQYRLYGDAFQAQNDPDNNLWVLNGADGVNLVLAKIQHGIYAEINESANPIANVWAHDGPYQNFTKDGARLFGTLEIRAGLTANPNDPEGIQYPAANPMTGEWALPADFFPTSTDRSATKWSIQGTFDWLADISPEAFLLNGGGFTSHYPCSTSRFAGPYRRVNLGFPNGTNSSPATASFASLNPLNGPLGTGVWKVCMNDASGKHDPAIPLLAGPPPKGSDNFRAMLMPYRDYMFALPEDDLAGIDRNGIVLRVPFLTTHPDNNQKIVITNRGNAIADYEFTITTEGKKGVMHMLLDKATGQINPGETCVIKVKDVVRFFDGEGDYWKGAGRITVAARHGDVDAAAVVRSTASDAAGPDNTNLTPDEGYNKTAEPTQLPVMDENVD